MLTPDGLWTPEVGSWSEQKYLLVRTYANLFASGTRATWKHRVYLDLFAGAGWAKLEGSGRTVTSSTFLALGVDPPFDRYIFCDADLRNIDALRTRVARDYPGRDVCIFAGDVNAKIEDVMAALPPHRSNEGVLSLCLVDPFNFGNFKFATIQKLATRYMDFLVLIPAGYDGNRNQHLYLDGTSDKLDDFLGGREWRSAWDGQVRLGSQMFSKFVIDEFGRRMKSLDYKYESGGDSVPIRYPGKNVLLYALVLFSRHSLGKKFWKATQKACNPQRGLELEF